MFCNVESRQCLKLVGKLPINIQNRFEKRESCYSLKGREMFKKTRFRIKLMECCATMKGISSWNNLNEELNIVFEKIIKASMLRKYNEIS